MIAFEQRASTVLFNLLRSHRREGYFFLPANICPIVPITLAKAGRAFEFVDIDRKTLCMNCDGVVASWTGRRKGRPAGLLYARTYGAVFDASETFSTLKAIDPDALIIDDRCLCPPDFPETPADHVDVALYSTGHVKSVDVGYGGYGVIRDGVPYFRAQRPFDSDSLSAITANYKHSLETRHAFAYRDCDWLDMSLPTEPLAVYRHRVEHELENAIRQKTQINTIYANRLPSAVQLPSVFNSWRFNIAVNDKAAVLAAIRRENLFASGFYDSLAGLFGPGTAPVAENLHRRVVNLFNDRYFSPEQAHKLTDVLIGLERSHPGTLS
ncbi:MAG: hypothetical protein IPN64_07280 [Propionivibrio sp.]|uniref:hypothetical protein n=1 Tax=Propionivibrio sp. TaxID=2212460 RepID=UPI0025DD252F|nr:hypothetical protein [Propionivibrio sp.]MBK8893852.1 hypothetical protein [Propionivibrio sp.]